MIPLPHFVIALLAMFIVAGGGGVYTGSHFEKIKYEGIIAQMRVDAAAALDAAKQKALDKERENNAIAQQLEIQHNEHQKTIDAATAENQRLVTELGGLYDRGAPASDCPGPAPAGTARVAPEPAPGRKLSNDLTQLLLSEARRADEAAEYANTCYQWVQQIRASNPK